MATLKNFIACGLLLLASLNSTNGQPNAVAERYNQQANDFRKDMKQDSAMVYFEKAASEFRKQGNIEKFIDAYNQIGIILTRQDNYEKAKTYLNDALSAGHQAVDQNSIAVATTYISLGVIYNAEGLYEQSLAAHNKALSIRLSKLGADHPEVATSYGNLGNVFRNNKEFDKSVDAHSKAMKIREKTFGLNSPEIVESYTGLGNAYREMKQYDTSLIYFEKALQNKIIQRGEGHNDLVKFYRYLSEVCYLKGDKVKGDEYKLAGENISNKSK